VAHFKGSSFETNAIPLSVLEAMDDLEDPDDDFYTYSFLAAFPKNSNLKIYQVVM